MEHKIGLVLSGGGARGVAHLGVIKALEEMKIKPSIISGTSAGAIFGSLYASGLSPDNILKIAQESEFFNITDILFMKQGFFAMKSFEKVYKQTFPTDSFNDLQIPMYIAATDIIKGETHYFNTGTLSKAIMASSAIPIVFEPIHYINSVFVDGGVLNNFPIEPLIGKCDVIIGSHVNALSNENNQMSMKTILDRSFHLAMGATVKSKFEKCDVFIEPPMMTRFNIFDMKKFKEIFESGYDYTYTLKNQLCNLL